MGKEIKDEEVYNGMTICGTPEHPCPCGWTFPHYPLGTTNPDTVLEIDSEI